MKSKVGQRQRDEKTLEEEDADARKDRKITKDYFFSNNLRQGRKVGSLKRRVRSQLAR